LARTRGLSPAEAKDHYITRHEVEEIRSSVEDERATTGGWIDCFRPHNKTLYRTLLGMSLQSLQQLTGANYFFYYGATVFLAVGLSDSFVTQIILGAVNFVCTFGGMYIMERVRFQPTCLALLIAVALVWTKVAAYLRWYLAVCLALRVCIGRHGCRSCHGSRHRKACVSFRGLHFPH
jgi:MFS family permease